MKHLKPLTLPHLEDTFVNMVDESESSTSFPTGETAQERGLPYVPKCYVTPTSYRPRSSPARIANDLPLIDLAGLRQGSEPRSLIIESIRDACLRFGFFQVSYYFLQRRLSRYLISKRKILKIVEFIFSIFQ